MAVTTISRAKRDRRYNRSEKGRARHRRYNQSEKGRARGARYKASPNGLMTAIRCSLRAKMRAAGYDPDDPEDMRRLSDMSFWAATADHQG